MSSSPESLGHLIKRAQYRHHRALDTQLARLGISLVQWNALREIARHPGSSMHGLAEQTFNSDQAFGTLTTRLLRLELIQRTKGTNRANVHTLTEKGEALFEQGNTVVRSVLEKSFEVLDDAERATLSTLLTKLLTGTDPK
jgi:DNA-binding MarR family transcriptional regulator